MQNQTTSLSAHSTTGTHMCHEMDPPHQSFHRTRVPERNEKGASAPLAKMHRVQLHTFPPCSDAPGHRTLTLQFDSTCSIS